jgi:hypothetical protein
MNHGERVLPVGRWYRNRQSPSPLWQRTLCVYNFGRNGYVDDLDERLLSKVP